MASLEQIFGWFKRGFFPTEDQYKQTWSSFWHKSERLPQSQVLGLNAALDNKANKSDLQGLIGGMLPRGEVTAIEDLPTNPNNVKTGYSYIVTNEKDPVSGLSYIYVAEIVEENGVKKVEWNNTKLTAYPKDVALLSKTTPINVNSTAVDILTNQHDTIVFESFKATFKGQGFYFVVDGKFYYASGGVDKEDYIINISKGHTRTYVFLNSNLLTDEAINWVDNPSLFIVVFDDDKNLKKYLTENILLFSTYAGNVVPSGLLSNTISKILARDSHKIHTSFVDSSDRNDIVKVDDEAGLLLFPKNFSVQDNENTIFASQQNNAQSVPTRCVNYETEEYEGSSLGYLFINKETGVIKNFWWRQLDIIPSQIWKMIGTIKRSTSHNNVIGEVTHLTGIFEWEPLGGSYADKAQTNSGIVDAMSDIYNTVSLLKDKVIFKKQGFSLYLHGKRYALYGTNDHIIDVDAKRTRINVYIDSRKLKATGSTNWDDTEGLFFTSNLDADPAMAKHYLLITYYKGVPMPVGLLSGFIPSKKSHPFRFCFYGTSSSNQKLKIIPSEGKMVIPPSLAIYDEFEPKVFYSSATQKEVPLIATDWGGVPKASSIGVLMYNREKDEFRNTWWSVAWNFPNDETWYLIGVVKRDTASDKQVGNIIFQSSLEIEYVGANSSDVTLRNQDIDTLVDASINKKYIDGVGDVSRFTFLHVSDVHADSVRFNNAIQYFSYKKDITMMALTGDIQAGDFTTSTQWLYDSLSMTSKPVGVILGNHDVGNSKEIVKCGDNQQVYERFIQPIEEKSGMITNGKNYWYKDFADYKIRVIGIYEYDDSNDIDPNNASQYRVFRGFRVLSQTQIDWLLNTLYDTPTDYAVIMLTHQNPSTSGNMLNKDEDWTYKNATFNPMNLTDGEVINEIVDAWMNGTTIDKQYSFIGDASYLASISVNKDFSTRGQGEFICYLSGHTHYDGTGSFKNFPKQKFICVTCATANNGQSKYDDLPRIQGQKSEDAFNIGSVDRTEGKIYLVRIGSNRTSSFEPKVYKTIDYKN